MCRSCILLTTLLTFAPAVAAQPAADSAVVARIYADLERGDVGAVVAVLDDHVLWIEGAQSPQAGRHFGPGTIATRVLHPQATAGVAYTPDVISRDRGYLVAVGTTRRTDPATGRPIAERFQHVWQVLDGLVVSVQSCSGAAERSPSDHISPASC